MKIRHAIFILLISGLSILFILNCYLLRQNGIYKGENRSLILQNDSLIAVTIELNRQISSAPRSTVHRQKSE